MLQSVLEATTSSISILRSIRNEEGEIINLEYLLANRIARAAHPDIFLTKKRFTQVPSGENYKGLFELLQEVVNTGEERMRELHFSFDGIDNYCQVRGVKMEDGVVYSSEDITIRKAAEQKL